MQKSFLSLIKRNERLLAHRFIKVVPHEQSFFHISQIIKLSSGCLLVNDKRNNKQISQYVGKHWSEVSLYLKAAIVNLIV